MGTAANQPGIVKGLDSKADATLVNGDKPGRVRHRLPHGRGSQVFHANLGSPGREGRYRASSPLRSERAQLTHSVPLLAASLRRLAPLRYPCSLRGRVCAALCLLQRFPRMGLLSSCLASLARVPPRSVPRRLAVLSRHYDSLPCFPSAYCFARRYHASPAVVWCPLARSHRPAGRARAGVVLGTAYPCLPFCSPGLHRASQLP